MKKNSLKLIVAFSCVMSFLASSCTEHTDYLQDIEQSIDCNKLNSCSLAFNATLQDFDTSPVTRGSTEWNEGDKIYLRLGDFAYGMAEFLSGSWVLNYYGDLTVNDSGICVSYFFKNSDFGNQTFVKLNSETVPFKSTDGKYFYDGEVLSVTANLKPLVGRIRFAGTPDSIFSLIGITRYSSYSIQQDTLMPTSSPVTLTVQSDGYTPYIYGFFTSKEEPRLNVMTGESGFNRKCSTSIFKTGESGWMDIPTLKSHNGWMNNLYFKVDSVGFTMLPVKYNSSIFYLAETELTEALYATVNNSSTFANSNLPQTIRYAMGYSTQINACDYFIDKLKDKTSIPFRLPTKDEWQFAAKGGEYSQGYTYSGSDVLSEVAWNAFNSKGKVHDVAQLMPNELGFYDMSGNLSEWTSTKNIYNSDYYYYCGGSFDSSLSDCEVTNSNYDDYGYSIGLRLALSIN